jgi:hypothetical protein
MCYYNSEINDSFLTNLLNTYIWQEMTKLQRKFRIYLSDCVNLMGVCDPYNTLKENEVYISIPN